jgi:hypothetical protein
VSDSGDEPTTEPAWFDSRAAKARLRRLRRLIGEQFAAAVTDDRLHIDLANGMLEAFGLPQLPRRWRVRIGLPMICEVTAAGDVDAYDAAAEAIENAVRATVAGAVIDIDFDGREDLHATPGDVDTEALATDWADGPRST